MSVPPDGSTTVTRTHAAGSGRTGWSPGVVASVVGCAVVVAVLGVGVHAGFAPQLRLDRSVSDALYVGDSRPAWLDFLLRVVTALGLSATRFVLALPVLVLLLRRRAWRTSVWVVVAVVVIGPLTTLLKNLVGRLRPQFAGGGAHYSSLSFPSGHSSGIATLVTVGLVLGWPLLSAAGRRIALCTGVLLVLAVGLTRILLGVHYLTDVVAGWALGIGWVLLSALLIGALPNGRAALRPAR